MKRILACLAALALPAFAFGAEPLPPGYDPIGDAIASTQNSVEKPSDWSLKVSLYHAGPGMGSRDSLGCPVSPMRTVAVDPAIVARHSIIYIKETAGLPLPDGGVHDGFWFASDIGGGIKGDRIDLFTGRGAASMKALATVNMRAVTVTKVGSFEGCPPTDGGAVAKLADAR
ncbi:MAG TPA: 3D domain-containing protein [Caulobacteraceae bacterium]|jgi:3D (Asp-Asp-Asp) domain-containing protein